MPRACWDDRATLNFSDNSRFSLSFSSSLSPSFNRDPPSFSLLDAALSLLTHLNSSPHSLKLHQNFSNSSSPSPDISFFLLNPSLSFHIPHSSKPQSPQPHSHTTRRPPPAGRPSCRRRAATPPLNLLPFSPPSLLKTHSQLSLSKTPKPPLLRFKAVESEIDPISTILTSFRVQICNLGKNGKEANWGVFCGSICTQEVI